MVKIEVDSQVVVGEESWGWGLCGGRVGMEVGVGGGYGGKDWWSGRLKGW